MAGSVGVGGSGGAAGVGGTSGTNGAGGVGGTAALPKEQKVLFVGGFMSQLYEELSLHLENDINRALQNAARTLNVHIDLPLNQSIDIAIGDAIANALPRIELPIEPGGYISFYTQMSYFDAEGIAYQNLSDASDSFDTSESVEHNAAAILEFLRSTDKQIIIVSHSKGGLDTLDALLDAPELWGVTVLGWVALQAPFHGSPVADPAPSAINALLLSAVGGNGQSVDDLKTVTRAPYMDANEERLASLTAAIPIISAYSTYEASASVTGFASTFAGGIFDAGLVSDITQIVVDNYWATPLNIPRVISASTTAAVTLIRRRVESALSAAVATIGLMDLTNVYMNTVSGVPNDGLVPKDSTALAGAIHRQMALGDHASPVMDVDPLKNFWTARTRNELTLELVTEVRSLSDSSM
jgi:pimeloyl-ACP methyl ester carboxylesterase